MEKKDSKKVAPDGLSKKERRALKVATSGKSTSASAITQKNGSSHEKVKPAEGVVLQQTLSEHVAKLETVQKNKTIEKKQQSNLTKKEEKHPKVAAGGKQEQNRPVKQEKAELETTEVKPTESKEGTLSKAELKAQRRSIQEAQRLAKQNLKVNSSIQEAQKLAKPNLKVNSFATESFEGIVKKIHKVPSSNKATKPKPNRKIQFFNHLSFNKIDEFDSQFNFDNLHQEFYKLGFSYANKSILGSNSRCLKMLQAIIALIDDIEIPSDEEFRRTFKIALRDSVCYLKQCRPFSVSMNNTVQNLNTYLNEKLDVSLSNDKQRAEVKNYVKSYVNEKFEKADESISNQVTSRIVNSDVILTYGHSTVVIKSLIDAHSQNKNFKVVIIDSGPFYEGRTTMEELKSIGIDCIYAHINIINSIIPTVTRVLFGAHAVFGNGCVLSRIGTAQIALIASLHNKSVMFCLESHKYADSVQADAFVYNEIDEDFYKDEQKNINFINIMYDVTHPNLYEKFVTELGAFNGTNAPHLLRCKALRVKAVV